MVDGVLLQNSHIFCIERAEVHKTKDKWVSNTEKSGKREHNVSNHPLWCVWLTRKPIRLGPVSKNLNFVCFFG